METINRELPPAMPAPEITCEQACAEWAGQPISANLIAAAPALLSALISLEQAYSNRHSPQHRASCLTEARAAIAKAEGRL